MKNLLLILSLLFSISSNAQNWELFPLDQKMYFMETDTSGNNRIELFLMDSLLMDSQDTIYFSKRNLDLQGVGPCYNDALEYEYWFPDSEEIDYLLLINNEVFYYWDTMVTPFFFLPNADIGQSWSIYSNNSENEYDSIHITCVSIQLDSFLGIIDSVKTFTLESNGVSPGQTPIENFKIKLSKNYGLIEFVPFYQFLYHPPSAQFKSLNLIGLENSGSAYGFQQPKFEDYLHLAQGDILLWHRRSEYNPPISPNTSYYLRDSLIDVHFSPDSIVYFYDREVQDPEGNITFLSGQSVTYIRNQLVNIMETPPRWLGFGNNQFGVPQVDGHVLTWASDYLYIDSQMIPGDTITSYAFREAGFSVDTTTCYNQHVWDEGYSFKINTNAGITEHCYGTLGYHSCTTLIASKIDGFQNGELDFPTSTLETSPILPLEIYPNPAVQSIYINNLDFLQKYDFQIVNSTGQTVKKGILSSNEIDIKNLKTGIYFILIFDNEKQFRATFLKQ